MPLEEALEQVRLSRIACWKLQISIISQAIKKWWSPLADIGVGDNNEYTAEMRTNGLVTFANVRLKVIFIGIRSLRKFWIWSLTDGIWWKYEAWMQCGEVHSEGFHCCWLPISDVSISSNHKFETLWKWLHTHMALEMLQISTLSVKKIYLA